MRRLLFALALLIPAQFATAQVDAQTCPPVSAIPDAERRTAYSISGSTGPLAVNFPLLGDGTDYGAWIEVWVNGVLKTPVTDWTLTIPSGTLATVCRPINNASVVFTSPQTGTVQIVGARRPRRTTQFPENVGVSARTLNQVFSDITTINRETWDKINDVTGRGLFGQPGVTYGRMPLPADCINKVLGFDSSGTQPVCVTAGGGGGSGSVNGPATSLIGNIALWDATNGTLIADPAAKNLAFLQMSGGLARPTLTLTPSSTRLPSVTQWDSFGNTFISVGTAAPGTACASPWVQAGQPNGAPPDEPPAGAFNICANITVASNSFNLLQSSIISQVTSSHGHYAGQFSSLATGASAGAGGLGASFYTNLGNVVGHAVVGQVASAVPVTGEVGPFQSIVGQHGATPHNVTYYYDIKSRGAGMTASYGIRIIGENFGGLGASPVLAATGVIIGLAAGTNVTGQSAFDLCPNYVNNCSTFTGNTVRFKDWRVANGTLVLGRTAAEGGAAGALAGVVSIAGATSGSINIVVPAVAAGQWTLQATNDVFVGRATGDNLSNKVLDTVACGVAPCGDVIRINGQTITAYREVLTANRTVHVRTAASGGSDTNCNGLDPAADPGSGAIPRACAFATVQKAIDYVGALDISIFAVTIQVQNGTYSTAVRIVTLSGPWVGPGAVTVRGDPTTPANVIFQITGGLQAIFLNNHARLTVTGVRVISSAGSGVLVQAGFYSALTMNNMEFEGGNQQITSATAFINFNGPYKITAGASAGYHWVTTQGGTIQAVSQTITLTGTPNFTGNFILATLGSTMRVNNNTFVGSATGAQCQIEFNSTVLAKPPAPAPPAGTELPGNIGTCATATGGQVNLT